MLGSSQADQNNRMGHLKKLRVTQNEVCEMLSCSRNHLNSLVKRDSTFPRPIKGGITKQASVYFDYQSVVSWWNQCLIENIQNDSAA